MIDSRAYDPDRLPWLSEEPPRHSLLTMVATLVGVLLATVLLAGVSYWLGMQSAGRPVSFWPLKFRAIDFRPAELWNDWRSAPDEAEPEPAVPVTSVAVKPLPAPGVQRAANSPAVGPPPDYPPAVSPPASGPRPAPVERLAASRAAPVKPSPSPAPPAASAVKPATPEPDIGTPATLVDQSRASFNCRLARTRGEIAVCSSGDLAALDRDLAVLTIQALKRADPAERAQLSSTRVRFLARRDACPSDQCLSALYRDRMREIRAILGGPASAPAASASPSAAQAPPTPKPQATQPQAQSSSVSLDPKSRASFSCRYARSRGEILVCNSAELSKLDRQLAMLYDSSLSQADAIKRARLQRTRSRFLVQREACRTEACVNALYVTRLREVSAIASGARPTE